MKSPQQPRVERLKEVWTPDAKLHIPHNDGEVVFAYPSFGPDTYQGVGRQILGHNLALANGGQTASLLYSTYCSDVKDEPEFKGIKDIVREKWVPVYMNVAWTDKGVFTQYDPEAKGLTEKLDINDLEKSLEGGTEYSQGIRFSDDGTVGFAPKDSYQLRYNTPEQLAQNGVVIAISGFEGAEKLAEISKEFPNKPCVHGSVLKEREYSRERVSALRALNVYGNSLGGEIYGNAFGVLE